VRDEQKTDGRNFQEIQGNFSHSCFQGYSTKRQKEKKEEYLKNLLFAVRRERPLERRKGEERRNFKESSLFCLLEFQPES